MNILKFFSFGSWNLPVKPDTLAWVIGLFVVVLAIYILKIIVLTIIDSSEYKGIASWFALVIMRILQAALQLSAFFIPALFMPVDAFVILSLLIIIYQIVLGIYFVSDDYRGNYVYKINEKLREFVQAWLATSDTILKNKKEFNKINKTIYVYRKNTIVG